MDRGEEVIEEEIVEEIIDDPEMFGEMVEVDGEEELLLEEMEEVNVDEVEDEQIHDGGGYHYVMHSGQPSHTAVSVVQQQRIQVYRVDKPTGVASAVCSMPIVAKNENVPLYVRQTEMRQAPSPRAYYPNVAAKAVPSRSASVPLTYRASEASLQHNRLLNPFLAARMAQKMRQGGVGNRKPCNCTKSMCLKLYCDCFANGEFCKDCNCKDCHNNLENEAERSRAIKHSLERNPNAFKPKIGVAPRGRIDLARLHQKGCHCKKSNCLKKYCECYGAKVPCTDRCKCSSCRNTESDRATKFRSKFGPPGDLRQLAGSAPPEPRASSPFSDDESDPETPEPSDPKTLPWLYMTDEVVEAATFCLVAQAEEIESKGSATDEQLEMGILKEFGRCLEQAIENASYTAQASAS